MKFLVDFLPIVAFFVTYKLYGIYAATAVAILINLIQVLGEWAIFRRVSTLQLISLGLIIVMGGSTLWLHNEWFIKWKPTILYWVLALVFAGSQFFTPKPFIQRLIEQTGVLDLPQKIWHKLNISWVIFFSTMGLLNLYVIYHFSTNIWVNFKLFGIMGLTLAFSIGQVFYLMHHAKTKVLDKAL